MCGKSRLGSKWSESLDWSLSGGPVFSSPAKFPRTSYRLLFFFLPLLKLFCLFLTFLSLSSPSIFFPYSLFTHILSFFGPRKASLYTIANNLIKGPPSLGPLPISPG